MRATDRLSPPQRIRRRWTPRRAIGASRSRLSGDANATVTTHARMSAVMAELTLTDRVVVPDGVLAREIDGETVLLNLDTGIYFGLDAVGTDMWRAIQANGRLQDVLASLEG